MSEQGNFRDFFEDSRQMIRDWAETKAEIYKLKLVRAASKIAGNFVWMIVMLFMASLFIIFAGVTGGYYLSEVTGSYVKGFGLVTLLVFLLIIILVVLRKVLFINPIIKKMIHLVIKEEEDK